MFSRGGPLVRGGFYTVSVARAAGVLLYSLVCGIFSSRYSPVIRLRRSFKCKFHYHYRKYNVMTPHYLLGSEHSSPFLLFTHVFICISLFVIFLLPFCYVCIYFCSLVFILIIFVSFRFECSS